MPHSPTIPDVAPNSSQPIAKTAAGTEVATAKTPSRDSHDERHCENARHARSGRPRWKTDETSPPAASTKAVASAVRPNQGSAGKRPSGTPSPISSNSANPAPDAVVKKTIERAGCMLCYSPRQQSVDPAQQPVAAGFGLGSGQRGKIEGLGRHAVTARRQVFVDRPVAEFGQ